MITLFPTQIHHEKLVKNATAFNRDLLKECYQFREMDEQGRKWSKKNYPGGYTSYGSISKLFRNSSTFDELRRKIDKHVLKYARSLDMDTKKHELTMTNLWVNIVPKHTYHGLHLHPLSTVSGTYYVQVPKNSGDLKFEDPRMSAFMGSAPRLSSARRENQRHFSISPKAGEVVLFESWLKHEVTQNLSSQDRVSVSFNYNWF